MRWTDDDLSSALAELRNEPLPEDAQTQEGLVRLASTRNDIVVYWDPTNQGDVQ